MGKARTDMCRVSTTAYGQFLALLIRVVHAVSGRGYQKINIAVWNDARDSMR